MKTSGDLIADRRYAYGADLAALGDHSAAADLFAQAIERAPQWTAAWFALAKARRDKADGDGAATAFRECLRLDPNDVFGASLELARLTPTAGVDTAPAAYVTALFDAYAPDFDAALVKRLDYSAPKFVAELIRAHRPGKFTRALDLGCGTGLAGEALRADAGYLEGVDIARGMLDVARMKGVYDALHHAEMYLHLQSQRGFYDLIVATDVFSYVGDLQPLISAVARRLAPDGLAAFTVEKAEEGDWTVRESLRFAHSPAYLARLATACGLELTALKDMAIRRDRSVDIGGLAVVLKGADSAN